MEREKVLAVEYATREIMQLLKKPPKIRSVFGKLHEAKINLQVHQSVHGVLLSALANVPAFRDPTIKKGLWSALQQKKTSDKIENAYDNRLRLLQMKNSVPKTLKHKDYYETAAKYRHKITQEAEKLLREESEPAETEKWVRGYFEELHRTGKIMREKELAKG